ncbi:MAG: DUF2721 domain-containing protein [Proteobacteria bacterium]|nr:DUF2721 domain-containing protein [Pseudomonadota bacterium]
MFPLLKVDDVTHVIQLAVAPVFLLTGVGTIISVLTNRLSRIVDRVRVLEERLALCGTREETRDEARENAVRARTELELLSQRMRLIYFGMTAEVCCGLLVGVIIAIAFIDAFLTINLSRLIALLFVLAMLAFIGGLMMFLREIFLAVRSTRASMRY